MHSPGSHGFCLHEGPFAVRKSGNASSHRVTSNLLKMPNNGQFCRPVSLLTPPNHPPKGGVIYLMGRDTTSSCEVIATQYFLGKTLSTR